MSQPDNRSVADPWVHHMATMMCGKNIEDELHSLDYKVIDL